MTSNNPASTHADDERAVRDVIGALYTAWAANDADAFAALYTEDATVVLPGVYRRNRAQARADMAAAFVGPLKGSRAIDEVKAIRFLGDDVAVVTSEGGTLMAGESELPPAQLVRATWVLARQDGTWLIAAYHNCSAN
jgi:uncharacterized protein (TIGR02246 family)